MLSFSRISKRRKSRSCICRWNTGWKRYRTSSRSKIGIGCAADVLAVKAEDGEIVYTCPLYGGTVLEDVKIKTTPQVATFRSGAFQKVENPTEG